MLVYFHVLKAQSLTPLVDYLLLLSPVEPLNIPPNKSNMRFVSFASFDPSSYIYNSYLIPHLPI